MIKVYSFENREEWDRVVGSFENYDVYYLSGYVTAFKINGDGEPLLFYYESSELRGINVVMKRDISDCIHFKNNLSSNTYFDFATPYGYGGWLLEGKLENCTQLFDEYECWCRNNNIVSEFVRFHPILSNSGLTKGFYDLVTLGNTVTLDISSPQILWQNITSKNRNHIHKAEKCGVEIKTGNSEELYEKFREIYNKTMEHDLAY